MVERHVPAVDHRLSRLCSYPDASELAPAEILSAQVAVASRLGSLGTLARLTILCVWRN